VRLPESNRDDQSSGRCIATALKQPTRIGIHVGRMMAENNQTNPYLVLLNGGVYLCHFCYQKRGALLPHHFTLTLRIKRYISVALSMGFPPPAINRRRCPIKPGLSSHDKNHKRPSDALISKGTVYNYKHDNKVATATSAMVRQKHARRLRAEYKF
jgi:hypothetical protein